MKLFLKKLILSLAIITASSAITVANAKTLSGTPKTVHKKFNAAAKKIRTNNRMVLTRCSRKVASVCNYTVTGNLAAIAKSKNGQFDKLEDIILIFAKGSNGNDMIIAMGLLMITYSPRIDKAERGEALVSLSKMVTTGETKRSVVLDDVKYTFTNLGIGGFWFTVSGN